jgi:hypothetical protein
MIQKDIHSNVMASAAALVRLIFAKYMRKYTVRAKITPHALSTIMNDSRLLIVSGTLYG